MTAGGPGSGPSRPKLWVSPLFVVPAGAAANYIGNAGGAWASVLAAGIGTKVVDTVTSCANNPLGWPATPTPDEIVTVASDDIGNPNLVTGLAEANQIADQVRWYVLCECV